MATYFFRNVGVNWGTATNWSLTDGGGATGAVPTATDDAKFTSNSGPCTVDTSARVCLTLDFTGYTNTITMTNGITVSGNVTLVAAMTIAGASGLTINAAATLVSNTKTWPNALTFTGGVTFTLSDNWTVSGTVTANGASGGQGFTGSILNCAGSLTIGNSGANIVTGSTVFKMTGTGTFSTVGIMRCDLTFNGTAITISGTINYNTGVLTYTAGTMTVSGSTLSINAATTVNTSGMSWNNVTVPLSGTLTLSSDLNMLGTFNVGLTTTTTTLSGAVNINVGTSLTQSGSTATISGTATIVMTGTGTWSSAASGVTLQNNLTFNSSGTVTFGTAVNLTYRSGTITYVAGTMNVTNSTLNLNEGGSPCTLNTSGMSFATIRGQLTAGNVTLTSDLNCTQFIVDNTFTFTGAFAINCSGNFTTSGFITGNATASSSFHITGTSTWSGNGHVRFNMFIDSGSNVTLSGTIGVETSGSGGALTINEIIHSSGCTLATVNAGYTLTNNISGTTFAGITFTPNGGLGYVMTGSFGITIGTLSYSQTSGGAATMSWKSTNTYTVNTAFNLQGTATIIILFKAITASSSAIITLGSSCTQDVSYVSATDIDSSAGPTVWDFKGTLTRTTNWNLLVPQITIASSFGGFS